MFVPVGTALSVVTILSVVAKLDTAVVTAVEQAPEAIALVPIALVPDANVTVTVPDDGNVAVELIPVPPFVLASNPVT